MGNFDKIANGTLGSADDFQERANRNKQKDGNNQTKKGAWEIKNKWDDNFIKKYRNELARKLKKINSSGGTYTCDDLALEVIVDFASKNNLPFRWYTGEWAFGTSVFDASDIKYSSPGEFLLDLKKHSGAADFEAPQNTEEVDLEHVQSGTLNVLTAIGHMDPNHIQIINFRG